jgi:hypothetical protein
MLKKYTNRFSYFYNWIQVTFYIIRTYFPKHKVEKTTPVERTQQQNQNSNYILFHYKKSLNLKFVQQLETLNQKNFKPNTEHGYSSSYKTAI